MMLRTHRMLTDLVELLRDLPEERFDYCFWVGSNWKGDPDLSCGTKACAAGWGTTLPSWKAAGLFLVSGNVAYDDATGGDWYGLDAVSRVLGLEPEQARFLFVPETDMEGSDGWSPAANATPIEVADHIQRWLDAQPVMA